MTAGQLCAVVLAAGGAFVARRGLAHIARIIRLLRNGARTLATVVDNDIMYGPRRRSGNRDMWFRPVVEFVDGSGVTRRVQTFEGSRSLELQVGTRVMVVYDVVDRTDVRVLPVRGTWQDNIFMAVVGCVALASAVWVWSLDL